MVRIEQRCAIAPHGTTLLHYIPLQCICIISHCITFAVHLFALYCSGTKIQLHIMVPHRTLYTKGVWGFWKSQLHYTYCCTIELHNCIIGVWKYWESQLRAVSVPLPPPPPAIAHQTKMRWTPLTTQLTTVHHTGHHTAHKSVQQLSCTGPGTLHIVHTLHCTCTTIL